MVVVDSADSALVDGRRWVRCTQTGPLGCNWLVDGFAHLGHASCLL